MKALYRKYRPRKLAEVVGQAQVTGLLAKSLQAGKISHAYLFIGPRGTGKTSVARIFAHEVNGFKYTLEDDYVDIVEIDGASNRGIDDVRELREKAAIAPTSGKYKVYIIDEVHMLTKEAFNALLKTLEEPPRHVIFIMATTDAYKVPVTITSRAQTFTFKLAEPAVMLKHLQTIAEQEKIKISKEALEIIVKRGGGSFRDSLSLLDQISTLSDDEITEELVVQALGLPEADKIQQLLEAYAQGEVEQITAILKQVLGSGVRAETLAEEMIGTIIDKPAPRFLPLLGSLPEVKEPFAEARLLVALCAGVKTPIEPAVAVATSVTGANFSWEDFLSKIQKVNEVVYIQLTKCEHEMADGALHIYPKTQIIKSILEKANNKQIIINNAQSVKITIHTAGQHPDSVAKDATLSKISAIMGGEVTNYEGGNSPF